ncbi:MAG: CysB family HTH-type transcriptional regulator [Betaproteobacteria bacterium]|nr:CysB family HTH-type transcriptional regulator [Betaproteobacteria bacterium]MDE2123985.1 CysB family HTH-type transcriptional regulator [Betaproteobacteria bacterium]MDE2185339.1 CysB family HTH-type transcriptional regulator [Betaproteobacteria bacterium]MDE2323847.1 CysB family HTH-type transcriptional regulator [Betaproteobacteria bacterium]
MNLHQFRFLQEAVRRNFNLSETARALFTSQPGVSKAIIELEDELGVEIFSRHGKRIRKLTAPGEEVLRSVEVILREVNNLKRIGQNYAAQDSGQLTIAATHTQARYRLPQVIAEFRRRFPRVQVHLIQGNPDQVAHAVLEERADLGLATESLADHPELITLPCYEWQHLLVTPLNHPLNDVADLSLAELARHPLVTYDPAFTGRHRIDQAFAQQGLQPQIVMEAIDSDVLKTYVELELGVGLIAEMAINPERDTLLRSRPLGHLFGQNLTRVAFKRGVYQRAFVYVLTELLSQRLSRKLVEQVLRGQSDENFSI